MDPTEHSLLKLSKDELARLVLDYQRKFSSVLQSLKDDVIEMKLKFNVQESERQVSKNFTDNLTQYIKTLEPKWHEMNNTQGGNTLRYQEFLAVLR